MSNYIEKNGFVNSIIGPGTRFDGDIKISGLLRVDGDYSGSIDTEGKVLIGKSGRAQCSINAQTVVIGGVVKGDIYAYEKVVILSSGMVIGNIQTSRLYIEEGVILHGFCSVLSQEQRSFQKDRKGIFSLNWEMISSSETK